MNDIKADLSLAMMAHVQKSGKAIEIIKEVLNHELFDHLSKHDPFWHQEDSDKLDDIRMKIAYIESRIIEVREFLTIDPYEGNV